MMKRLRGSQGLAIATAGAALAVTGAVYRMRSKRAVPPESGVKLLGEKPWKTEWAVIAANREIEDRYFVGEHKGAVLCGVFDGHYGPRTADFCRQNAPIMFRTAMAQLNGDETAALQQTFEMLEEGWVKHAKQLLSRGDFKAAREGACGLVAYITPEKVVLGNVGDSRAVLFRDAKSMLEPLQLTREHNAADPRERIALIRSKPNDSDAVTYNTSSGAWYVKDTLQVTRAIGDLFLKHREFHDPLPADLRPSGPSFHPPYVSWEAEVTSMELDEEDLFLVLASDGLWDELSNSDAAESVRRAAREPAKSAVRTPSARDAFKRSGAGAGPDSGGALHAGEALLWDALRANPHSRFFGVENTLKLECGDPRRDVHDDISVVVVWLQDVAETGAKQEG